MSPVRSTDIFNGTPITAELKTLAAMLCERASITSIAGMTRTFVSTASASPIIRLAFSPREYGAFLEGADAHNIAFRLHFGHPVLPPGRPEQLLNINKL